MACTYIEGIGFDEALNCGKDTDRARNVQAVSVKNFSNLWLTRLAAGYKLAPNKATTYPSEGNEQMGTYTETDVQALMNEVEANKAQISALESRNQQIRLSLVVDALGEEWKDQHGVKNIELAGVALKMEFKQNYSVKAKELPAIMDKLSEDGKKAFKFKPELSLTAYKELGAADLALVNSVITSKPALPTVSYKK